ncbi:MAG: hypothetical protein ACNFW9_03085 [Candidatus Kerfeldbacteria bacterium]
MINQLNIKNKSKIILKFIIILFFLWFITLQIVAFVSINFTDLEQPHSWPKKPLETYLYWARWDSKWYSSISTDGYYLQNGNSNVTFFPLYPSLMKISNIIFNVDLMWAGFLISIISIILSLYYLYRLILIDFDKSHAKKSLVYLLFLPAAFFLISTYAESLFLLEIILSFYFARNKKWLIASIFALLAGITRIPGTLLFPVLIIEYLSQNQYKLKNIRINFIYLFSIPLGLASLMFYYWYKFNDALIFLHNQTTYLRHFTWPHNVIKGYLNTIFINPNNVASDLYLILLIDLTILILYFIILIISFKKLRLSYSIFLLLNLLILIFTGTFSGMSRYILPLFPAVIVLGFINNKFIRSSILIVLGITQIYLIARFVNWYWVG